MQPTKRSGVWHLVSLIALAVAVFIVFGGVLGADFLRWDDNINVYENPHYHPVTGESLAFFWTKPYYNLYMPVTSTVWALIAALSVLPRPVTTPGAGSYILDPTAFHAVNLLFHVVNVALIYALLLRLLRQCPRPELGALIGAALFAVHPVQAEAVSWVTGLNNLTTGCFCLLAMWLYFRPSPEGPETASGNSNRLSASYFAATACFVLALFSKPTAVVLPVVAFAIECWLLGENWRVAARKLAPWLVIALAFSGWTYSIQEPVQGLAAPLPLWQRVFLAGDALLFLAGKVVWPVQLGADYGRTPGWVASQPWFLLCALPPLAALAAAWLARRRLPPVTAGIVIFVAALLPVTGLVPYYFHLYSTVADRYLYLAMLGPVLVVGWFFARPRPLGVVAAAPVVLLLCAGLSFRQTQTWTNSVTMFNQALAVNPRSWMAYYNLAWVLETGGQLAEAEVQYRNAVRVRPDYADAYNNLALNLANRGQWREAVTAYHEALKIQPQNAQTRSNLGNLLMSKGQSREGLVELGKAVEIDPGFAGGRFNLAIGLQRSGRRNEAIQQFQEVLRLDPNFPGAAEALQSLQTP